MKSSIEPQILVRPPGPYLKPLRLVAIALLIAAILSIFLLAPDAENVQGSSWSPPLSGSAGGCYHQVRTGENLFRIGLRYGLSYQYLAAMNGILNPDQILAGSALAVPCGASTWHYVSSVPCASPELYVVKPGDNLFRIALNYGSTVDLIRFANNLYGRVLLAGMSLTIPCPGSVSYGGVSPPPPEQPIQATQTPLAASPAATATATPTPTATATPRPTPTTQPITPQITPAAQVTPVIPVITVQPTRATAQATAIPVNPSVSPLNVNTPAPSTALVNMRGNQFVPDSAQIQVGGRVTWVNDETDGTAHTVTCEECPPTFSFNSGSKPIGPHESYSVLFTIPGVFFYDSRLQPQMTGMVIVSP